ncbi:tripartite tricarboxylate transporter TctB family protein [Streptomyces montanisoli]|uniref:Tripartite tricarboxylate transporter TctB family protein n=1 Tax=Streptomyces montanisoli TaxID=2798581 RepID=A0A940RUZ3_9ACTN|nr:tripartite tricarboxylate transporter TctB family protein [Streptomyces montanisoli]MBP0457731.1 tripartite tricarboxylate transporter TctB family protein [Streptomyces montanisoli]
MSDTAANGTHGERRRLHLGELLIDLAIVAGSLLYLHAASKYPPQGRQVPDVVGWIALALGALHLLAHVVPGLWGLTHGKDGRRQEPRAVPSPAQEADEAQAAAADGETAHGEAAPASPSMSMAQGDSRQILIAIAWIAGLLAGTYVLGYAVAIPLFFFAYFAVMRAWRTAVVSAVVMGVLTEGVFALALSVPLPTGMFW